MRFYTKQHPLYCGIDLPARTMYVCLLDHQGEILLHRNMPARPETFLKAIAPYREDIVVAVACMFTWYGLADLCAREGMPLVLGHALSMKAMHGGKAKNDKLDAQKIAVLLRGGMLPQASVSPAAMRATRDLLRRRMHLRRKRAALLAHIQHTNSQYNLPEMGKKLAYKGKRDGVAARFLEPAVQKSVEVDLALLDHDDRLLSDVALTIVQTAKQPNAPALDRRQSVPGIGKILRVVLLYEMHAITRFPRVQDCVSSCRLVTGAKASAGKRSGTSGKKMGHAYLKWACAEAAVLCLRNNPQGQKFLARLEKKHGQGKALPILAHKLARAVYDMLTRDTVFEMDRFLNGYGSRAGEPAASLDTQGISLSYRPGKIHTLCVIERATGQRHFALSPRGCLDTCSGSLLDGAGRQRWTCAAPLPNLVLTGEHHVCSPSFAEDGMRAPICFEGAENSTSTLCHRHPDGGRPSRRVWCSHVGCTSRGNEDGTRCQRRIALGLKHSGKKWAKSASGGSLSLDNRGPHKG